MHQINLQYKIIRGIIDNQVIRMEFKESILSEVKDIYNVEALTEYSNKGHNGIIYNYGDDKLIKVDLMM